MPTTRTVTAVLLTILTIAACGAAAGASPTPAATPQPTPTAVPGNGGLGGGSGGNSSGGGSGGGGSGGMGLDPILGQATFVGPTPGLINQHSVSVQLVRAAADDVGATAELRWWSGIAPCNALDSVQVDKDETARTIKLTVIEGSGRGDVACIDIAQLKATLVDLGKLAPGTWTISAEGDARSVELEVAWGAGRPPPTSHRASDRRRTLMRPAAGPVSRSAR